MDKPTLLIVGCGDLGSRLGLKMADINWSVYGARRNTDLLPPPIKPIAIDLYQNNLPNDWSGSSIDYLVFCVAPNRSEHEQYQSLYSQGLQQVIRWLKQVQQTPKKLLIVSSSAVYHQNDGQWIDEASPTIPISHQGKVMLEMEGIALNSGFSSCCVRLAGIYGENRTYLINQAKQGVHYPTSPLLYANRIHIDDAAELIKHLLIQDQKGNRLETYYNGVDDCPAPIQETLNWLREQLAITSLADNESERKVGSKRLSNQKAKKTGWKPYYPSYKEGYLTLLTI